MARILIVDDSIIMRRNLKVILTQAGHEVVSEASNGKEAYMEYEKHLPDIVTMDITMPVMNGIDAVKKIVGSFPNARVIMISALDQRNMVFEALENGAKHYIIKPITPDKVLTVLDAVLEDGAIEDASRVEAESAISTISRDTGVEQVEAQKEKVQPFTIENQEGTFVISINNSIDMSAFTQLGMAVQGFMFIKPLKITIKLNEISALDNDLLIKLLDIVNNIKSVGGAVKIVSQSEAISESLRLKGIIVEA